MNHAHIAALLAVGVLVAGCGGPGVPSAPTSSTGIDAMPTPTATPMSPPASSPGGAAPHFTVDCGPIAVDVGTCLAIVGVAASGLALDHPPVTAVAVVSLGPDAASAPSPPPAASPAVEIETFTLGYRVGFSWAGGGTSVPVSRTATGWLPGLPRSVTRTYRVSPATRTWTEPVPFDLPAGEYLIQGGCGGSGSTPGGATVILERLRADGTVLADVHRVRCGPVELAATFGDHVTLAAGSYRLAIESNTGSLEVELEPAATLN